MLVDDGQVEVVGFGVRDQEDETLLPAGLGGVLLRLGLLSDAADRQG